MAEATPSGAVDSIFGIANTFTLRSGAATTTSYVASAHFRCIDAEWFSLEFVLAWADSTSHQWYIEWSNDGSNFYRELNTSTTAGVDTMTANNRTYTIGASGNWVDGPIRTKDIYARVQVKKTGGVGADAISITATTLKHK